MHHRNAGPSVTQRVRRIPIVTVLACGAAVLASCGSAASFLAYDRTAIVAGQWWRGATAHFTHWSADHLFWDGVTFLALGATAELRSRQRFVLCTAGASLAITLGLFFLRPEVLQYRGMSGIDSALFLLVAAGMARDAVAAHRMVTAAVAMRRCKASR